MQSPYSCDVRHDPDGRIIEKIETVAGEPVVWAYGYDQDGRLIRAQMDGRIVCEISYDRQGRRIRDYFPHMNANFRTYQYSAMDNRLQRAGNNGYTHDENGFRSIWNHGGQYTLYTYGSDYRLIHAEKRDARKVFEFTHDEHGGRAVKYCNGKPVEAYNWLDMVRLASFHDGDFSYNLVYHGRERMPHAMQRGDGMVFQLFYDQVGSLRVVADTDGNVIKEILYDPFGGIMKDTTPSWQIPLGFAGGLHDRDLGFVRFGWRDYDTFTGRWTAPDPLGAEGGDPDWYGYCLDDPVNGADPLGLFRFGKRPLSFLPSSWHWIGTDGSTADIGNYELKHEHGFYEGGSGRNIGLSKEGILRTEDITEYALDDTHFDDKLMRQAEDSLDPGDYKLCKWGGQSNNCQDYADALRGRYRFLRMAEKH